MKTLNRKQNILEKNEGVRELTNSELAKVSGGVAVITLMMGAWMLGTMYASTQYKKP